MPETPAARDPVACLAIHGLGGGPWELAPLTDALTAAGHRVACVTLPGHDTAESIMPASCWSDWARVVTEQFDALNAEVGRVAVIGFSTGATLALKLATERPVAKLVTLAPFLAICHTWRLPLATARGCVRLLAGVVPNLARRRPPVRDPAMRIWVRSVERYKTFSMSATISALELIERVKPLVPTIRTDTLVAQGLRDSVVDPHGARWLVRSLAAPRKEALWLPRSDHLVALDFDRDTLIDHTRRFLAAH